MEDELECFRKASELGCPDFGIDGKYVNFMGMQGDLWTLPVSDSVGGGMDRINRYAAAVCAEWWHHHRDTLDSEAIQARYMCQVWQMKARAFGKKYGQ